MWILVGLEIACGRGDRKEMIQPLIIASLQVITALADRYDTTLSRLRMNFEIRAE